MVDKKKEQDQLYVPIPRLLLTGWKEIGAAFGMSADTAKIWWEKFNLPIFWFGSTPALSPAVFDLWCSELMKRGKLKIPSDKSP